MSNQNIITPTKNWVEKIVVGMNLCPFAKREIVKDRVRYTVSEVTAQDQLLMDLKMELELLNANTDIETTLLIHPNILHDFYNYNDFLELTDSLLVEMKLDGVYQIASFHPDYQFGGTDFDDAENYTNRSPYQMLHLIREASLEKAVTNYPDPDNIPERNIKLMNELGTDKMKELLEKCFQK
ncbi:DUF1415 domain-containing protein [Francisella adeliensis]|uniref:DUF1415 domain-containing protein n=1 Tax=Francisella adeliensis TaxID=2007306 RepID=A0A2Z4Y277_9GAMM|nr:DUF1415 domain-containing protein [Francisella adeliensis]AXA34625.1 hypothetical protein CDH04_09550 [Francisella adeliensis]MBK2086351.1 DUF1415 domain-containing protein [Francisella adeliensis]MBK2096566.1 DUF1415 domain-containing protein [Francisella adeliensis]QIW12869.1 DUF1415 domain-containing protein [Francisella adeliensis]QIW14746.1 DUF1415 domain-containing protein [Francisella adeliensis]